MEEKKLKNKKTNNVGITLIALIITIIVLLILAVVAIRAVQGDGIIAHAKNARDRYNQAQVEENGIIQNYVDYITEQLKEKKTVSISCEAQDNGVIKVNLAYSAALPSYEEYAGAILAKASEEEKNQIFIKGSMYYHPEEYDTIENVTLANALEIEESETIDEWWQSFKSGKNQKYSSFEEALIGEKYVNMAEYNQIKAQRITVTCSDGQTKKVSAAQSYTQFTVEESGSYTFSVVGPEGEKAQTTVEMNLANPVEKITVLGGDINGDGSIDSMDVTPISRYADGWKSDSLGDCVYLFDVGDVDGDGDIDEQDADYLSKFVAKWTGESYAAAVNLNKPITVVKKK